YGAVRVDGEYVDPKSRITLAGRHGQILNENRRKHLVDRAVDLLRTVEFSRWQNEAPVRHGLRVGFILQGHEWHASDNAAADIVHRAFNLLGYRLYREEGLTVRKRRARRRAVGTRAPILV